jgi:drug/metabolite transporter (DMT)-like permease
MRIAIIGRLPMPLLITHGALFLAAVIWGANFAAVRVLLNQVAPLDVLFLRLAGAAVLFAVLLFAKDRRLPAIGRRDMPALAAIGIFGVVVPNLAIVFGQARVPAALASLIITSNPIHTAVISRVMTGEPLTRRKIGGIVVAFFGFLIVLLYGSVGGVALDSAEVTGVLILAIAPLTWAFYTVLSKPYVMSYPSLDVSTYTTLAATLVLLPLPIIDHSMLGRISGMDRQGWLAALFATVIAFVLGYILWYRGLRHLTPSQTAVYLYLVPVFGLLTAWVVLDERPTPWLLLGGATILAGVILTNTGSRREPRPAPRGRRGEPVVVTAE